MVLFGFNAMLGILGAAGNLVLVIAPHFSLTEMEEHRHHLT
jgi:hypothetical protein